MSWKCDICDTYNDDQNKLCCVCDQPRSAASVLEGRRLAREARRDKLRTVLLEKGYPAARIFFYASAGVAAAAVVVGIVLLLVSGDIGILFDNLGAAARCAWGKGTRLFPGNLRAMGTAVISAPFDNCIAVVKQFDGAQLLQNLAKTFKTGLSNLRGMSDAVWALGAGCFRALLSFGENIIKILINISKNLY